MKHTETCREFAGDKTEVCKCTPQQTTNEMSHAPGCPVKVKGVASCVCATIIEHTPTPWAVSHDKYGRPFIVGRCHDESKALCPIIEDENNAAFIVRAVNAHETLVEAIQYALASEQTDCVGKFMPTVLGDLRTLLEKAIAKAEGK